MSSFSTVQTCIKLNINSFDEFKIINRQTKKLYLKMFKFSLEIVQR